MQAKLKLFDTRTKSLQEFTPIQKNKVGMYHCGPTVYARGHLGNLRPYIHWDILRRTLEMQGLTVTQVMNFTDIGHLTSDEDEGDDKMVKALKSAGAKLSIENLRKLGQEVSNLILADLDELNIRRAHHLPFATDHIQEDIEIIKKLEAKGLTYTTPEAVYFDTGATENYDVFNVHGNNPSATERVAADDKKDPRDFALWKINPQQDIGWDSPWGVGFPGWHIECSAMSWRYLGEHFDIHTGGIEHIPIHHTNEIAQSENAFGKVMANYWLHNNHLLLEGKKISKSLGNVYYLSDLKEKGFSALDFRYLILTSHYRAEIDFSWTSLEAAQSARARLQRLALVAQKESKENKEKLSTQAKEKLQVIQAALLNDLNTAQAIGLLWQAHKELDSSDFAQIIAEVDQILGLGLLEEAEETTALEIPRAIEALAQKRLAAREQGDWPESDRLRDEIKSLGWEMLDTKSGYELCKNNV